MMIHTYTTFFLVPLMSEALISFDDLYGLLIHLRLRSSYKSISEIWLKKMLTSITQDKSSPHRER